MTTTHPLAGFEFSTTDLVGIIAVMLALAGACIVFASLFMAYLVSGAQHLHREGRLRHPMLVVVTSMAALVATFEGRYSTWAPYTLALGLGLGYAVMLRAGTSWFRWTAVPASVFVFLALVA